jgi:glycosyltransferase involved in cell wall biosynthesis
MSAGADRLRIAYVAYGLVTPARAHNLQTVSTVDALAARGHDLLFVNSLLPADRATDDARNLPACETILIPAGRLFELHRRLTPHGRFWSLFADRSLYAVRALRRVRVARSDAIVTRDLVVCLWASALTRKPVAYELHSLEQVVFAASDESDLSDAELVRRMRELAVTDFAGHQDDPSMLGRLYKWFLRRLEDAALRRATVVLPLTATAGRRLGADHRVARWQKVPSGHALPTAPRVDRAELRRRLGVPLDRPLAVYAGLSLNGKGIESLYAVAAQLASDCAIVVVGPDDEQCAALAALRDERGLGTRLLFVPRVEHDRVADYLRACDVGLLLYPRSRALGEFASPLKLLEYLASGLPVVATRLESIEEIVVDGVNGRLVPAGDAAAAAAAVDGLLGDERLLARLAAGGQATAEHFTYDRRAERIDTAVRDALVRRPEEAALCIST